jgi:hypothetical protein
MVTPGARDGGAHSRSQGQQSLLIGSCVIGTSRTLSLPVPHLASTQSPPACTGHKPTSALIYPLATNTSHCGCKQTTKMHIFHVNNLLPPSQLTASAPLLHLHPFPAKLITHTHRCARFTSSATFAALYLLQREPHQQPLSPSQGTTSASLLPFPHPLHCRSLHCRNLTSSVTFAALYLLRRERATSTTSFTVPTDSPGLPSPVPLLPSHSPQPLLLSSPRKGHRPPQPLLLSISWQRVKTRSINAHRSSRKPPLLLWPTAAPKVACNYDHPCKLPHCCQTKGAGWTCVY